VLVRRFALAGGDAHDDQLAKLLVRPRNQIGQPGLFDRFPEGDGQRVALPRVAVPAHLQPGLLPLVPAQQYSLGLRVHDQRGGGHVQRKLAPPRISDSLGQGPHPPQVCCLDLALRLVMAE
jgi:hypothetical protein